MIVAAMQIRPVPIWLVMVIGFVVLIAFLQYFAFDRHVLDEVCDAGDSLVFRKGDLEQIVLLEDIEDIEVQHFATEIGVTVYCRHEGVIGSRFLFAAQRGDRFFSPSADIAKLLARFENLKSK